MYNAAEPTFNSGIDYRKRKSYINYLGKDGCKQLTKKEY